MRLRDPFTGKFITRDGYRRAQKRLTREREKAFRREDDARLARLTEKARKYPPLVTRKRRPPVPVLSLEWEFGLDYRGQSKSSHIDLNIRIVSDEPIDEKQARGYLFDFAEGRSAMETEGVSVEAVSWRRKKSANWKHSQDPQSDLESFRAIIYTEGADSFRAGAVKPDIL